MVVRSVSGCMKDITTVTSATHTATTRSHIRRRSQTAIAGGMLTAAPSICTGSRLDGSTAVDNSGVSQEASRVAVYAVARGPVQVASSDAGASWRAGKQ